MGRSSAVLGDEEKVFLYLSKCKDKLVSILHFYLYFYEICINRETAFTSYRGSAEARVFLEELHGNADAWRKLRESERTPRHRGGRGLEFRCDCEWGGQGLQARVPTTCRRAAGCREGRQPTNHTDHNHATTTGLSDYHNTLLLHPPPTFCQTRCPKEEKPGIPIEAAIGN